jgi:hypothetical protein
LVQIGQMPDNVKLQHGYGSGVQEMKMTRVDVELIRRRLAWALATDAQRRNEEQTHG